MGGITRMGVGGGVGCNVNEETCVRVRSLYHDAGTAGCTICRGYGSRDLLPGVVIRLKFSVSMSYQVRSIQVLNSYNTILFRPMMHRHISTIDITRGWRVSSK